MTPHHQHPNDPQHPDSTPPPKDAQHPNDEQRPEDEQCPNDEQHPTTTQRPNDARHPDDSTRRSKDLLAPREVAALLRVGPKTISHWARKGHLEAVYTPGGHRRFHTNEIQAFLQRLEGR